MRLDLADYFRDVAELRAAAKQSYLGLGPGSYLSTMADRQLAMWRRIRNRRKRPPIVQI